jgi:hypothetical protein
MIGSRFLFVTAALALAGCDRGAAPPPPPGGGVSLPDVSRVRGVDGRKVDAGVMRSRRVAGRWTGRLGDAPVAVTFDASSASFEMLRADGALVASGSGAFSWTPDGSLRGTADVSGALSPFSSWSASFPSPGRMAMAGADGAGMELSRPSSRPSRGVPVPKGWGR